MIDTVERTGQVIGFDHGVAQIRLEREAGCSGCGSRGTCASGSAATQVIPVALLRHARLGDHVTVSMPSSSITQAALLGYLLPPVSLLAGAILADTCFGSDLAAVLGALSGFVAGLILARLMTRFAFGQGLAPTVCHTDFQPGEHS